MSGGRTFGMLALVVGGAVACGRTQSSGTAPPVPSGIEASVSSAAELDAGAVDAAGDVTIDASVLALPEEPWYHDRDDRTEDCVPALPVPPRPHFPAPFEACDPRAESYTSPPGGGGLHFHYRFFSVDATKAHRAKHPKTCCYLVWEFPRRHAP